MNVFDVVNFDMVNRIQLDFSPSCIEWVHKSASSKPTLAVGCAGNPRGNWRGPSPLSRGGGMPRAPFLAMP